MLTSLQCAVLAVSIQVGHPDLKNSLPALALVESSLGERVVGDDGLSFGPWQMQVATAQEILGKRPWLRRGRVTDLQVKEGLLEDPQWAARLAVVRLRELISTYGWANGHRAYRAGETGMKKGRARERPKAIRLAMKDTQKYASECGIGGER